MRNCYFKTLILRLSIIIISLLSMISLDLFASNILYRHDDYLSIENLIYDIIPLSEPDIYYSSSPPIADPCSLGASTDGTPTASDFDGDGINDVCDLDDDNDGIPDDVECSSIDLTTNGSFNYSTADFGTKSYLVYQDQHGGDYTTDLSYMFPSGSVGYKDGWTFYNTVDWTEGQYIYFSEFTAKDKWPLVKESIEDKGAFIIFSKQGEAISNTISTTIGETYEVSFEMGLVPAYSRTADPYDGTYYMTGYLPDITYGMVSGAEVLFTTPFVNSYSESDFPDNVTKNSADLDPHWRKYVVIFKATSSSAQLKIVENTGAAVICIDGLKVKKNDSSCDYSKNNDSDSDGSYDAYEAGTSNDISLLMIADASNVGINGLKDDLETFPDSGILAASIDIIKPYDGISSNPTSPEVLWYRADYGVNSSSSVPASGTPVNTWYDNFISNGAQDAIQASLHPGNDENALPGLPDYIYEDASYINFNPVVRFSNDDLGDALGFDNPAQNNLTLFVVFKATGAGSNQYDSNLLFGGDVSNPGGTSSDPPRSDLSLVISNASTLAFGGGSGGDFYTGSSAYGGDLHLQGRASIGVMTRELADEDNVAFSLYANGSYDFKNLTASSINPAQSGAGLPLSEKMRLGKHFSSQNDGNINGELNGDIAEVILIDKVLTNNEREIFESYLAIKYGITLQKGEDLFPFETGNYNYAYKNSLGENIWISDVNFKYDVAGIARDDKFKLNQKVSKSINDNTIVTMSTDEDVTNGNLDASRKAIDGDRESLMWANDHDDDNSIDEITSELPISSQMTHRLDREWKVQLSNTDGTDISAVSVSIDISALSLSSTLKEEYRLLIDSDGDKDFSTGTIQEIAASDYSSGILRFDNVDFLNNDVFTLAADVPNLCTDGAGTGGVPTSSDLDGDGLNNYCDLDSDNDGILDTIENNGVNPFDDIDNDNIPAYLDDDDNDPGVGDDDGKPQNDIDNDGIANFLDIDSDNDGITDKFEECSDIGFGSQGHNTNLVNNYTYTTRGIDVTYSTDVSVADRVRFYDPGSLNSSYNGPMIRLYNHTTSYNVGFMFSQPVNNIRFKLTDIDQSEVFIVTVKDENGNIYDLTTNNHVILGTGVSQIGNTIKGLVFSGNPDGNLSISDHISSALLTFPLKVKSININFSSITGSSAVGTARITQAYFCLDTDTDLDGIPNRLDLDSDGDSCPDSIESEVDKHVGVILTDAIFNDGNPVNSVLFNDGQIASAGGNYGNNGLSSYIESDDSVYAKTNYVSTYLDYALVASINNCLADCASINNTGGHCDIDNDGTDNFSDIDNDNDGILDIIENNGVNPYDDIDNDGVYAYLDDDDNNPGVGDDDGKPQNDFDNDGVPNFLDLDSDNDGISDVIEAGGNDPDGDGVIGSGDITDTDSDGLSDIVDSDNGGIALLIPNTDTQAGANFLDIDSDDDGIPDNVEGQSTLAYVAPLGVDDDSDGIDNAYDIDFVGNSAFVVENTDGDAMPDYLDLDSDDDGISDTIEIGKIPSGDITDIDSDGLLDIYEGSNNNDPSDVNDEINTPSSLQDEDADVNTGGNVDYRDILDSDNDGIMNILDLDNDNDGILDTVENSGVNPYADIDNDGIPAYLDDDDNNAAIGDYDAKPENDIDNDGIPNFLDLDSDNDGIYDVVETNNNALDADNDGVIDGAVGTNGVPDTAEDGGVDLGGVSTLPVNTDGDAVADYLDIDSDNDAIPDNVESQDNLSLVLPSGQDADKDGIDDAYDLDCAPCGAITGFFIDPLDFDSDSRPNHLDIDADNDGVVDNIEAQSTSGYKIPGVDSDGNGLADIYETAPGSGVLSYVIINVDGSDMPDYIDLDSDDDGLSDSVEVYDLDGDNIAEIIASGADSDNDGLDDSFDLEASGIDNPLSSSNNAQDVLLFPNDQQPSTGEVDFRDPEVYTVPVDSDNDGITNNIDIDDDNDGILDYIEALGFYPDSPVNGCILPNVNFTNPVYIAGTGSGAGSLNAKYRFENIITLPNVGGIDAIIEITDIVGGASLISMDNSTSGDPNAWQPEFTVPLPTGNIAEMEFNMKIVLNGSSTIHTGTRWGGVIYDIDGANARESIILSRPGLYAVDNETLLTITDNLATGKTTFMGPDDTYSGVDLSPRLALYFNYYNSSEFTIRFSSELLSASANTNLGSVLFDICAIDGLFKDNISSSVASQVNGTSEPSGPSTFAVYTVFDGIDSDNDGISDDRDIDSDNDGITDNVEAQSTSSYIAPAAGDADGDGLLDVYEGSGDEGLMSEDTDADKIPDYLDIDSDNDGLKDLQEAGFYPSPTILDGDKDGLIDDYDTVDTSGSLIDSNDDDDLGAVDTPNIQDDTTVEVDFREFVDVDNDGITDILDIDNDNDGIVDVDENDGINPYSDIDKDGVFAYLDDDDNDPLVGDDDNLPNNDFDNDGIPNFLDIDSDNDGIPDNVEGQSTLAYVAPSGVDDDNDGLDNVYDTDFVGNNAFNPQNSDSDSDKDYLDLDSDNDGFSDTIETGNAVTANTDDTDGDGLLDAYEGANLVDPHDVNDEMNIPSDLIDIDGDVNTGGDVDYRDILDDDNDGITNIIDLDNDNDGILDVDENNGINPYADVDNDGVFAYLDDDDNDPLVGDDDNLPNNDFDNDGVPNFLDLDSDNDGITDVIEAGGDDPDQDGVIGTGVVIDSDNDGISDIVDADNAGTPLVIPNTDNQSGANFLDIDSDDDGIPDNVEGQATLAYVSPLGADDDNDGIDNAYDIDFVGNSAFVVENTDTDALPDYLDLDSDEDGISDIIESGSIVSADITDTDNDGLLDIYEGADLNDALDVNDEIDVPSLLQDEDADVNTGGDVDYRDILDTDNDGITDTIDIDNDNDGIVDIEENNGVNPYEDIDNDGVFAYLDDDDNDPLVGDDDNLPNNDFDNDGIANFLDIDSDNDGIPDNVEGQSTLGYISPSGADDDSDGLDNVYDADFVGNNAFTPTNTDGDSKADYLDLDSDNDGLSDTKEIGLIDTGDVLDSDNDGLLDIFEGSELNDPLDVNDEIDTPSSLQDEDTDVNSGGDVDYRDLRDTDKDGIADLYDLDNDNDGIVDLIENNGVNPFSDLDNDGVFAYLDDDDNNAAIGDDDGKPENDADNDGVPNFLDLDSDNDGIYDVVETNNIDKDSDHDGTIDGPVGVNGIPDAGEDGGVDLAGVSSSPINTDGDSVADYLDIDSDNDAVPDNIEAQDNLSILSPWGEDYDGDGIDDAYDLVCVGCTAPGRIFINPKDTDLDGRPDYLDIDADNDGIVDNIEAQSTLAYKSPGIDSDGNGLADIYETAPGTGILSYMINNADGTDYPDYLDLDSDNDGLDDSIEAYDLDADNIAEIIASGIDSDNDGLDDSFDLEASGIDNPLSSSNNNQNVASLPNDQQPSTLEVDFRDPEVYTALVDSDNDGITNDIDIDDDNDGILDYVEALGFYPDSSIDACLLPEVSFTNYNYVVGSGSGEGSLNAKYRFENVAVSPTAGILDVIIEITDIVGGASLITIDNSSTGHANSWQPEFTVPLPTGNIAEMEFKVTIVLDGTNTTHLGTRWGGVIYDIDGANARESVVLSRPGLYAVDNETLLNVNDNLATGKTTFVGPDDTYSGIDLSPRLALYFNYYNSSEFTVRFSSELLSASANTNLSSVLFDICAINGLFKDNTTSADPSQVNGSSEPSGPGTFAVYSVFDGIDSDNDGISDERDIDSDNDGITDNVEAQATFSYIAPDAGDADNDGLLDVYEGTGDVGLVSQDTDADKIPDYLDADSDSDGISDLREAGFYLPLNNFDVDNDGLFDAYDRINTLGMLIDSNDDDDLGALDTPNIQDTSTEEVDFREFVDRDNDGITDVLDLDNDNDGILDKDENDGIDPYSDLDKDGIFAYLDDDDNDPLIGDDDNLPNNDFDNDGIANFLDIDSDNDGIPDNVEGQSTLAYVAPSGLDDDNDGVDNVYDIDFIGNAAFVAENTDGGAMPDYLDLDSDDDGISDTLEIGKTPSTDATDTDSDGLLDVFEGSQNNDPYDVNDEIDIPSSLQDEDADVNTGGDVDYRDILDSDNDGIMNIVDLDNDNDGILDIVENNGVNPYADIDNDGILAYLDDDDNNAAIGDDDGKPENDSDNDGIPNFLDLDSDNDGIYDVVETNNSALDADNDGVIDGTVGVNGVPDSAEDGGVDLAGVSSSPVNTDGDAVADYLDIDSDNDAIPDNIESQDNLSLVLPSGQDSDNDGIDDAYDLDCAPCGAVSGIFINPLDFDSDSHPNHLDIDADNDGVVDNIEAQSSSGYKSPGVDSDGNGLADIYETSPGSGILSYVINNADGSDTPDYLDLDSDNDGLSDSVEVYDLDADNIAEIIASGLDSDNDGLDDSFDLEASGIDNPLSSSNNNQDVSLFPNDQQASTAEVDFRDPEVYTIPVDSDNDGITNNIDIDDDNDGILDYVESLGFYPDSSTNTCVFPDVIFTNPSYVVGSGSGEGSLNAQYRFEDVLTIPNVGLVDAIIEISDIVGGASLLSIDNSITGDPNAWQPEFSVPLPTGNIAEMEFKVKIVLDGTNDVYPVNRFGGVIYDIDGANARESVVLSRPGLYAVDNETLLTVNDNLATGKTTFVGPDDTYAGVDLSPRLALYFNYYNSSEFTIRFSSELLSASANTNLGSVLFNICGINGLFKDNLSSANASQSNGSSEPSGPSSFPVYSVFDGIDSDEDGIADERDIDSDNDGITDNVEAQSTSSYVAPLAGDTDGDGLLDIYEGVGDEGLMSEDTDSDNIPDYLDDDSDNDGLKDLQEAGFYPPSTILDADKDGLLDDYDTVDTTGILIDSNDDDDLGAIDTPNVQDDSTVEVDFREFVDIDNDGITNISDLDNDNDGILDIDENNGIDPYSDLDKDGVFAYLDDDDNDPSVGDDDNLPNNDFDNDGIPNFLDLDSDNDGITDVLEAGGIDPDADGVIGTGVIIDSDSDGLSDIVDADNSGTPLDIPDTDSSEGPNYIDVDSDGDFCFDSDEAFQNVDTDSNNDGSYGAIVNAYDVIDPYSPNGVDENGLVNAASYQSSIHSNVLSVMESVCHPIAKDDVLLNLPTNTPAVVDVFADNGNDVDIDPEGNLDATSVSIINGEDSDANGSMDKLVVPGEGVWMVDLVSGAITFTPEASFTSDPTDIKYTVRDDKANLSNEAVVSLSFDIQIPIAKNDVLTGLPTNIPALVDVFADNGNGADSDPDGDLDATSVSIIGGIDTNSNGSLDELVIPNEGVWTVDSTTGAITFTPEAGFTSDPTDIKYTVEDNDGNISNEAVVSLDFDVQSPIAMDDSISDLPTNTPVVIDVFADNANGIDTDPDGQLDATSVSIIDGEDSDANGSLDKKVVPGEGVWMVDPVNGAITFTPEAGFTSDPTDIKYTVEDNDGNLSNEAIVSLGFDIQSPIAMDDNLSDLPTNTPAVVDVFADNGNGVDSDPDGQLDATSVSIIDGEDSDANGSLDKMVVPGEGVWMVDPVNGAITFTPEAGFTSDPTDIKYTVEDNDGNLSNEAIVSLSFDIQSPIAMDDNLSDLPTNTPAVVDVFADNGNGVDSDPDGQLDATSVSIIDGEDSDANGSLDKLIVPGEGVWMVDPVNGAITFTPEADFTSDPTDIKYTVEDNDGNLSNEAILSLSFEKNNPVAVDDLDNRVDEDTELIVDVISENDEDDGYLVPESIILIDPNDPTNTGNKDNVLHIDGVGDYSINAKGELKFIPVPYFNGIADIFYSIEDNDGNISNEARVAILVNKVYELSIPEGFSPNGDGLNDFFVIKGLNDFPNNKLIIYNRWGSKVYERSGYLNTWDGRSENNMDYGSNILPKATYYYILDLGNGNGLEKGYLYLNY